MSHEETTPFEEPGDELPEGPKPGRIKQHWHKHKTTYLMGATGVVCFVAGTRFKRMGFVPEIQQNAKNIALVVWKSPPTNIALVKNACPNPIPVLDKMTGIPYPSIRRAAAATGRNIMEISKDAQGAQEFFEVLPETVFA